jgi:hypothetical protein
MIVGAEEVESAVAIHSVCAGFGHSIGRVVGKRSHQAPVESRDNGQGKWGKRKRESVMLWRL